MPPKTKPKPKDPKPKEPKSKEIKLPELRPFGSDTQEIIPDDAKLKRLERRRLRKEKAKRKKLEREKKRQEKKIKSKRDFLSRESRYGTLNFGTNANKWKQLLVRVTLPSQRNELEFMNHNFERVMDAKDFTISYLMDQLNYLEEIYILNLSEHVSSVDRIFTLFYKHSEELKIEYNQLKRRYNEDQRNFRIATRKGTGSILEFIKVNRMGMEKQAKNFTMELAADLSTKRESHEYDEERLILQLKGKLDCIIEPVWLNMKRIYDEYTDETKSAWARWDMINRIDEKAHKVLRGELRKVVYLTKLIKTLRKKLEQMEIDNPVPHLKLQEKLFRNFHRNRREALEIILNLDKRQRTLMISEFYNVYEAFEKHLHLCENMIRSLKMCRKLESIHEKVLPYPLPKHKIEKMDDDKMVLFWQKIGQAEASRLELRSEKKLLKEENERLKYKIGKICTCMTCPRLPPICRKGPIPITEGVALIRRYRFLRK